MLRFLLWRLLGLLALLAGLLLAKWFLNGGPGRILRGSVARHPPDPGLLSLPASWVGGAWSWAPRAGVRPVRALLVLAIAQIGLIALARWRARNRRSYVRLRVETYRTDQASAEAVVRMFEALHKRLLRRWWRRLLLGQPAVALEVHHDSAQAGARARRTSPGWRSAARAAPSGCWRRPCGPPTRTAA